MAKFLHSKAVQLQTIAADAVVSHDLAVNPLSVVLLNLRPLNETSTLANFASYMAIAAAINKLTILHSGVAIVSAKGEDLAALAYFRHGCQPYQGQHDDTDNERRCVTLPIFMGRRAYDPHCCYPAVRRGELTIELDFDVADTGYDNMTYDIETIELPGATPTEYERKVQIAQTTAATGLQQMDLPLGNVIRSILLYGTTPFGGASPAPSWGRIATLLDNMESNYSATDWEVLQAIGHALWGRLPPSYDNHQHHVDATGGATQATANGVSWVGRGWENYALMDYDVTKDDNFSLDTRQSRACRLRYDAETADAIRALPVEVIRV